nr:hypothetical protein Iba_chr01cCG0350 [Ipomoea batatas]
MVVEYSTSKLGYCGQDSTSCYSNIELKKEMSGEGFYLSLKFAFHLATIPGEPLDCSFGAIRTNLDGPNASDNLPALLISSSKSSIGHCTFLLDIFSSTKARSTMIPTAKLIAIPKILLLPSPLLEADGGGCWRPMLLTAQGEIIFPQSPAFPSKLELGKLKN